jgi:hypothetical protein
MGHPASSWFGSTQGVEPRALFAGLIAAAVRADMPDLPFHKIYYDLYQFGEPPKPSDGPQQRAAKSRDYYDRKFVYNAYLALKQRDRFARFLKAKLGDLFELIGDHWGTNYGLDHTPRVWDMGVLHRRMRQVPICLNLMKGNLESGLNIRHFEITSHGGFMLTYFTPELSNCFEIGRECDVFRNEAELLEKIAYYLEHSEERKTLAGCCLGIPYSGPGAIDDFAGLALFPAPILEMVFFAILALLLLRLETKRVLHGRLFSLLLIVYGVFRFASEPLRDTPKALPLGGSVYQAWALALVAVGVAGLLWRTLTPTWRARLQHVEAP